MGGPVNGVVMAGAVRGGADGGERGERLEAGRDDVEWRRLRWGSGSEGGGGVAATAAGEAGREWGDCSRTLQYLEHAGRLL